MKIERLSENQMRFTVWRQELEDNDIDISDIAGNKSGKADELLKMLMNRAKDEFGFEPESAPLVVEAMQVDQISMTRTLDDPRKAIILCVLGFSLFAAIKGVGA
jgi:adapter protein MecA 1/2